MYFRCCCSITNARFLSLYINYIKSIWTTRTNLRLDRVTDRANSQMMSSYPVRFSADILSSIFHSCFCFCLLVWLSVFFFFLKLKIYILTHIRLCVWMSYQKNSPGRFLETRLVFFLDLFGSKSLGACTWKSEKN